MTVQVAACGIYLDGKGNPVGNPWCSKPVPILMDPSKPESGSTTVDITTMYNQCVYPTRIRAYIDASVNALDKVATVIDCQQVPG